MATSNFPPSCDGHRRRVAGLVAATAVAFVWTQDGARAEDQIAATAPEISLEQLSATRERPLFSPSRRPRESNIAVVVAPPPPPPAPALAPPPPPNLTFLGTFEGPTEVGATIQLSPNDKPISVRYGTYVAGWRVVDISKRRLVLALGDRKAVFTMFNSPESVKGEVAAPPPPSGPQSHPLAPITPVPGSATPR